MKWRPKSFFMGFDLLELLLIYLFMAMPFDSSRSQFTIYIYIYTKSCCFLPLFSFLKRTPGFLVMFLYLMQK